MIPKRAHISKAHGLSNEVHELLVRRFMDFHPDWEICELKDDPLFLPEELSAVARKNSPGIASELTKMWAVYLHGGVAFDSNILFLQSLDNLLRNKLFHSRTGGDPAPACVIGAEEGEPSLAISLGAISTLEFEIKSPTVANHLGINAVRLLPHVFCPFRSAPVATQFVQEFLDGKDPQLPKKIIADGVQDQVLGVWLMGGSKVTVPGAVVEPPPPPLRDPEIEASLLEMGVSFGGAVMNAVGRLVSGKKVLSSPEEVDRRSWICAGNKDRGIPKCDFFAETSGRCAKCGCKMSVKIRALASSCPIGKW
jgi:hypothetical protein